MGFRLGLHGLALAGAALIGSPAAFAQAPAEGALAEWVASIDASPSWVASYRTLSYDAAADTASIAGLVVRTEGSGFGFAINIESLNLAGYATTPAGGFSARSVTADGGVIEAGFATIAVTDVELTELSVPALAGMVYDAEKPFTSMMRGYAEIVKTRLQSGRIGKVEILQKVEGVTSRVTYEHFRIDNLADGKIASIRSGPLSMEAPSPQGLVKMSVDSVETSDLDLGAFVSVYDPDSYVNGVGDMVWRKGLRVGAYHNLRMEVPGAKIAIEEIAIEGFDLRQPKKSFAEFLDLAMAHSDMSEDRMNQIAKDHIVDMLSAFRIGRFGISGFEVATQGVDRFYFAGFHVSDLSIEGLGEFAFDGVDVAVADQGAAKVGRFAFGGIVFPGIAAIEKAIAQSEVGLQPDPRELAPHLGFLELAAVDVRAAGMDAIVLDKLRFDLADYVGYLPTRVAAEIAGLIVPVSVIDDPNSRAMFERLGYKEISATYGLGLHWNEADETLAVDDVHFKVKDVGSLVISAALGGLPRSAILNPETLPEIVPGLALVKAKLTFKDDSIVGKGLDILAGQMNAPPDKFRQQFADALPFLISLTAFNDPKLMAIVQQSGVLAKLQPVIKQFVGTPGASITVSLAPSAPVPLPAIIEASQMAPESLIGLLGMSFSGEPGTAPKPAN